MSWWPVDDFNPNEPEPTEEEDEDWEMGLHTFPKRGAGVGVVHYTKSPGPDFDDFVPF